MTKQEIKKEQENIASAAGKLFGALQRVSEAGEDQEVLNFAVATLATFRDFCEICGYNFAVALKQSKELNERIKAEAINSRA